MGGAPLRSEYLSQRLVEIQADAEGPESKEAARGTSRCKGLEVGEVLEYLRNRKEPVWLQKSE